ncbi:hypothetical protein ACFFF7_11965 [Novosphingobium aquiterrae]|uniref:Uncharacterized protein n=1 Tax=Novosphingobium aquiterrae TaxID=624388 RepID=A0ABV6PJW5_9SPHN
MTSNVASIVAILLSSIAWVGKSGAQDRIGEIVQPASGTGRAVYAALDQAVILPRFLGKWAIDRDSCRRRESAGHIELQQRLAIMGKSRLAVQAALVEIDPDSAGDDGKSPRARDYANADDILVRFGQQGREPRYIHFRFGYGGARLIVEEVGQPRRAYVRCA